MSKPTPTPEKPERRKPTEKIILTAVEARRLTLADTRLGAAQAEMHEAQMNVQRIMGEVLTRADHKSAEGERWGFDEDDSAVWLKKMTQTPK